MFSSAPIMSRSPRSILKLCFTPPSNIPLFINVPPAGEDGGEWQKELVNGSQNVKLKGLKVGLTYRVRVVAKGHHDQPLHSEDVFVTVPGEALVGAKPPPWSG